MADLESIQKKIISFTPIEILTRNDAAQIALNVHGTAGLPFSGILWISRGVNETSVTGRTFRTIPKQKT